jgi:hypothetical protein
MRALLRLRAWQLFLLLFGIPVAVDLVLVLAWDSLGARAALIVLPVLITGYVCLLCAWMWSVAVALNATLPEAKRWRTRCFTIANAYEVVYALFFLAVFHGRLVPWSVVIPLHLCAMLVSLYVGFFVARSLVMSRFGAFRVFPIVGTLLLLWMLPIGLWVIQPWVSRATRPEGHR